FQFDTGPPSEPVGRVRIRNLRRRYINLRGIDAWHVPGVGDCDLNEWISVVIDIDGDLRVLEGGVRKAITEWEQRRFSLTLKPSVAYVGSLDVIVDAQI